MYKYVNPNNRHLEELKGYGASLVIEIIEMLPDEYQKNIDLIDHGIQVKNYEEISRGVHSIKSNLRYFIDITHSIIEFCQDFENRAKDKYEEFKLNHFVENDVDFTADFEKLKDITTEPIQEIFQFGEDFKNS